MQNTWLVIFPPIFVLGLTFFTRNVIFSLIAGILMAGLIVANFGLMQALETTSIRFIEQFEPSNLYTFGFLLILGTLITLMTHTGGTAAYGRLIRRKLTDPRLAETASIGLSFCFGIDDFFSILTVGSIMRPVTDSFHIARAKLAFLLDCMAAPLVILVPVSTWVAMVLMQLNKAGISLDQSQNPLILADPFAVYLQTIPFIFYSFIIISSVLFIVRWGISFGPMARQEKIAHETANLFGGKNPLVTGSQSLDDSSGSLINFLLPLGSLLTFVAGAVLISGHYHLVGGQNSLMQAIQTADIFFSLFIGSVLSCTLSLAFFFATKQLTTDQLPSIAYEGYALMKDSIIILLFAWTFSSLLKNDLQAGNFLAQKMIGSVSPSLLPFLFFITAFATATGTGSSWGTIAVLIPLAVPMITTFLHVTIPASIEEIPLILPVIGAVFAGAVAGDNLSPIGTTTVMAATSSQSYLNDHAYTQLPYGLPAFGATCISYLIIPFLLTYGYWASSITALVVGIFLALSTLSVLQILSTNKR
jgi:Na+/H+ antiporter NhaC